MKIFSLSLPAMTVALLLSGHNDALAQSCTRTFSVTPATISIERTDARSLSEGGLGPVEERIFLQFAGGTVSGGDTVCINVVFPNLVVYTPASGVTENGFGVQGGVSADPFLSDGNVGVTGLTTFANATNLKSVSEPTAGHVSTLNSQLVEARVSWGFSSINPSFPLIIPTAVASLSGVSLKMTVPSSFGAAELPKGQFSLQVSGFYDRDPSFPSTLPPVAPMLALETIDTAINQLGGLMVDLLSAEGVGAQEEQSLSVMLNAALASVSVSNESAAAGQLRAFVNSVNALVNSARLSEDAGEILTKKAQELIARVRPRKN